MTPARTDHLVLLAVFLCVLVASLALGGCSLLRHTPAQRVEIARGQRDGAREVVLHHAQIAVHETVEALESAPASRPVEVARVSAGQAAAQLDQANGALPVSEVGALQQRIAGLLSDNAALRSAAEAERSARDRDWSAAAARLAQAETRLAQRTTELEASWAREHALARKWRRLVWSVAGASIACLLSAVVWLLVRLRFGNVSTALGRALAHLQARMNPNDVATVRAELDAQLTPAAQKAIRRIFTSTNAHA